MDPAGLRFRGVVGPGSVPYLAGYARLAGGEFVMQATVGCRCFLVRKWTGLNRWRDSLRARAARPDFTGPLPIGGGARPVDRLVC